MVKKLNVKYSMCYKTKYSLDIVNRVLLSELQRDGRIPLSHIGKKTGMSHVAVRKRLEKMVRERLVNISADLNVEALEAKIAAIIVEVENSQRLRELTELFRDCPRTVFLSGLNASNLLTIIACEDLSMLESVIGVCSLRVQKGVRRSEVHIGSLPIYPQFLPIRINPEKKAEIAPCTARCDQCESFESKRCLGCPATKFYKGPL